MRNDLVYLPVEVSRRELTARAFLACRLAASGHDVLVFVSDLFDRFGWPGPGVYIGKNVLRSYVPHDLRFYRAMKAAGIDVWYHDEEAGILPGEGPEQWNWHLKRRTDASGLGAGDKVLTWGEFQTEHFASLGLDAEVVMVGSANFELYRPDYAPLFAEYDRKQTGGLDDYVLFNTRFATANGYYTGKGHAINSWLHTGFVSDPERFETLSQDGILLYHFIGLISELALANPQMQIVVRPHPAENPEFYRQIFSMLPNVHPGDSGDAGSWIRRARCLVQNGCTTAIQANIAGKPVITFIPPDTHELTAASPLPNEVGTIVHSRHDAIAAIRDPVGAQASGRWPMAISKLDTIDTIDRMVGEREGRGEIDEKKLESIGRKSSLDHRARRAAYPFFPRKQAEMKMRERFLDRGFFNRFDELADIARKRWGEDIRVERVAAECWRVRPPR